MNESKLDLKITLAQFLVQTGEYTFIEQALDLNSYQATQPGVYRIPEDAELAILLPNKRVNFYTSRYTGIQQITPTTGMLSQWDSLEQIKVCIANKKLNAVVIWERDPEESRAFGENPYAKLPPRSASDIADAALTHIRQRAETYDSPEGERSALKTAQAFNAVTGKDLTEAEVFLILQLLKDVRQWQKKDYHRDSSEDAIAYAALKAEALEKQG